MCGAKVFVSRLMSNQTIEWIHFIVYRTHAFRVMLLEKLEHRLLDNEAFAYEATRQKFV